MDINRLKHAIVVANEGSLSAAAQRLPMSQSALTRSIQALEQQFGIRIFERGRKGARLTDEGSAFISVATEALLSVERAEERLDSIASGQNATVRFGAGPLMTGRHLPHVLTRLTKLPVRLEIHTGTTASLTSLLSRGEIDFFLGGTYVGSDRFLRANEFDWEPRHSSTDEIFMVLRRGHPLIEGAAVSWGETEHYPVASESFVTERLGGRGFERLGFQRPSVTVDDYRVLAELALRTDYLVVSNSDLTWVRPEELSGHPVPRGSDTLGWEWGFLSSRRLPLSRHARAVLEEIKRYLQTFDAGDLTDMTQASEEPNPTKAIWRGAESVEP
ncbi:LysR family transcriptional regulator [Microbacterium album]|nr:LysR family transcriptional regulator [Microbacterium album]